MTPILAGLGVFVILAGAVHRPLPIAGAAALGTVLAYVLRAALS